MDVKICTFENTSGNPFRVSFPRKLCHLWPSFFPFFVGIQAFPSPEDYRRRPVPINADVERVRRYHCKFFFLVNDIGYKLENTSTVSIFIAELILMIWRTFQYS